MKKHMSIKARITLWYAALIVFICGSALFSLFAIADRAQEDHCRKTLESAAVIIMDEMEIEHGVMEIDKDIDEVPGVYAALFDAQGELIYGRSRAELPFEEGIMRRAQASGHSYMVRDTAISVPGMEMVWLRVYMAADLQEDMAWAVVHEGLWLLPILAVIALVGGYLITARAFKPVGKMSCLAASIAGGGDLSRRVQEEKGLAGRDELHALADTLNEMLERLERAFERERQFASDAAHELRTPLNAMQQQGEYALSCLDVKEKDEAVAVMLQKNEEMRILIGQLLLMARLDAGQMEKEDAVSLEVLIASIAEDLKPVAEEKGVMLETMLEDVCVCGNRSMLTRAVINLVDNAIRYGRSGTSVRIYLAREGDEAIVRVEDDGCGMDAETLEHVFDRFWRADHSRMTAGTGIGLAIARSAVRAHGGEIAVESRLGEGSCFTIRLPLKKET